MFTHLTAEPFRGSQAIADGAVTPGRLRGPEFAAVFRGVYVGSSVAVDAITRARALALRAGSGAVVAGPLAAHVLGADCPWDDAEVILPSNRRFAREDVLRRLDHLERWEIANHAGLRVTSPARTAFDLARRDESLVERVAAVDALARTHLLGAPALQEVADAHPEVRGTVAFREVLGLMDPLAESLMETRTRLVLRFGGLPLPVSQLLVPLPAGGHARLDLAWEWAKVAVEYDGEDHRSARRHADDLDREAALVELGWRIVHVTARQVYRAPDDLCRRVGLLLGC